MTSTRDLGLLKRDKKLQKRYDTWAEDVKKSYGSIGTVEFYLDAVSTLILLVVAQSQLPDQLQASVGKT